ncbi:putative reverse transcriptase domain-containing protein [Tanacetum coccineum]
METNPRDQVKSISTAKADFSGIRRIGCGPYAVSGTQHRSILSKTVPFPGRLLNFGCDDWREAQDVKILDAYDQTLPQKEKDPGSFTLPCFIHNICFDKALVDLGASVSVMPFSTYTNLGLGILSHTRLTIELVDRTIKQPRGIAENVLVRIGKFIFPIDFIILDIPEDDDVPLILGQPFLSTAHSKIDVFKRKITLREKDERGSHAGTLIDIPVFVGSLSIISGFTIIDDDDMTKDVVLGMRFYKKYTACQRIIKKFALENNCERIMKEE